MLFETQTEYNLNTSGTGSTDGSHLPLNGLHCQVEYSVGGEILFVQCQQAIHCPHQLFFGGGCICKNQARISLYNHTHN